MKFLSVENEVDQAIQMVNSDESTDPKVVTEVANYKEELEKLKSQDGGEDTSSTGSDEPSSETGEGAAENSASGEGSDDTGGDDGESEGDESSQEPSEEVTDADVAAATEAFDVMVALEKITNKLEVARNKGGADQVTVQMALECSDILARRIGFHIPKKSTIALESGDGYTARRNNTVIAIEEISQIAKDIWEAIKRFFKTMYNWVKEYIFGIKQVTNVQEDALKEIKDANKSLASKLNKYPLTEETLEKLSKTFYKAKAGNLTSVREANVDNIFGSYNDMVRFGDSFLETQINIFKNKITPAINELSKTDPDIKSTKVFIDENDYVGLKVSRSNLKNVGEGLVNLTSEALPGGRFINIICPDERADNSKYVTLSTIIIDRGENRTGNGVQISSASDINTIVKLEDSITGILKLKLKFLKTMDGPFLNGKSTTQKILDSNMSHWKNVDPKVLMSFQQDVKTLIKIFTTFIDQPTIGVINYIDTFATALEDYAAFSQKQLSKALEAQIKAQPAA